MPKETEPLVMCICGSDLWTVPEECIDLRTPNTRTFEGICSECEQKIILVLETPKGNKDENLPPETLQK